MNSVLAFGDGKSREKRTDAMLTDQEKEHIREEEFYRQEVRSQLEITNSKGDSWQKYWSFINSGVFIWFLSSIVIGSCTFLYARWEKEHVIERENQHTANRLDAEISNRLSYFNNLLKMRDIALSRRILDDESIRDYDLSKLVIVLERPTASDYPSNVFPEYGNRNLRSLLWELMQVVPQLERESIQPAYQKSLALQSIYLNNLYGSKRPSDGGLLHASQAAALAQNVYAVKDFYSTFNLSRWGSVFTEQLQKRSDAKRSVRIPGK